MLAVTECPGYPGVGGKVVVGARCGSRTADKYRHPDLYRGRMGAALLGSVGGLDRVVLTWLQQYATRYVGRQWRPGLGRRYCVGMSEIICRLHGCTTPGLPWRCIHLVGSEYGPSAQGSGFRCPVG